MAADGAQPVRSDEVDPPRNRRRAPASESEFGPGASDHCGWGGLRRRLRRRSGSTAGTRRSSPGLAPARLHHAPPLGSQRRLRKPDLARLDGRAENPGRYLGSTAAREDDAAVLRDERVRHHHADRGRRPGSPRSVGSSPRAERGGVPSCRTRTSKSRRRSSLIHRSFQRSAIASTAASDPSSFRAIPRRPTTSSSLRAVPTFSSTMRSTRRPSIAWSPEFPMRRVSSEASSPTTPPRRMPAASLRRPASSSWCFHTSSPRTILR
jgi:hypothetical protein